MLISRYADSVRVIKVYPRLPILFSKYEALTSGVIAMIFGSMVVYKNVITLILSFNGFCKFALAL